MNNEEGTMGTNGTTGSQGSENCEKCQEYLGGWKRALADYDNLVKDLDRARGELRASAKEEMIQSLLPVLDNFDQATRFAPEGLEQTVQNWLSGILHVRNQLEEVLKELGAEPFGAIGESFDPNLHDAIENRTEEGKGDQEILDVAKRGWKLNEKLIRPASVIVNSN